MNKLLLAIVVFLFTYCKAQEIKDCGEANWLSQLVENKDKAAAFTFIHNQKQIIEFHHCYQCPDAIVSYYDCLGNKICDQGGFIGSNNCPEYNTSEKVRIYPKSE